MPVKCQSRASFPIGHFHSVTYYVTVQPNHPQCLAAGDVRLSTWGTGGLRLRRRAGQPFTGNREQIADRCWSVLGEFWNAKQLLWKRSRLMETVLGCIPFPPTHSSLSSTLQSPISPLGVSELTHHVDDVIRQRRALLQSLLFNPLLPLPSAAIRHGRQTPSGLSPASAQQLDLTQSGPIRSTQPRILS